MVTLAESMEDYNRKRAAELEAQKAAGIFVPEDQKLPTNVFRNSAGVLVDQKGNAIKQLSRSYLQQYQNSPTTSGTIQTASGGSQTASGTSQSTQISQEVVDIESSKSDLQKAMEREAQRKQEIEAYERSKRTSTREFGQELGLSDERLNAAIPGSTFDESKQAIADFDALSESQKKQIEMQRQLDSQQTAEAKRQLEMTQASVTSQLSPGREGVVGTSRFAARDRFTELMDEKIQQTIDRFQIAEAQRQDALRRLEIAQRQNDKSAIQSAQADLAGAEQEVRQAEAAQLQAAAQAQEMAMAVSESQMNQRRQNLNTMADMVESGVEMTPAGMMQLANQLNIPKELAFEYYAGAESIRQDKSLNTQEKQLAIAQLTKQTQDVLTGYEFEEARKIRDFTQLVKSGDYTDQEISTLAASFNIADDRNPFFQAEMKLQNAKATLAYKEANGLPISTADRLAEYQAQATLNSLKGVDGGAYIPNKSLEGIEVSFDGGKLHVSPAKNADGSAKKMQCGEFVNRAWGLSSGGSGGFGNYLSQKQSIVNKNGITAENILSATDPLAKFAEVIKPGMAFVSNSGGTVDGKPTGHVGIVTQVNADGTFVTMEANLIGDLNEGSVPQENVRNIKDGDLYGFATPPDAKLLDANNKPAVSEYTGSEITILNNFDGKRIPEAWSGTDEEFYEAYNKFEEMKSDPNLPLVEKMRFSQGGKQLLDKQEQKMESFVNAANGLKMLEEKLDNIDMDTLAPVGDALRKRWSWDKKRKELDAILTGIVPGLARGVYGEVGVLTDEDIKRYSSLLPKLKNTKQQREALMNILKQSLYNGVQSTLSNAANNSRDVSKYTSTYEYVSNFAEDEGGKTSGGLLVAQPDNAESIIEAYSGNSKQEEFYAEYGITE